MNKPIRIRVPAVPVAQPRHRIGVVEGKAQAFEAKKSHAIHDFKASVRLSARQAYKGPPLEGPLRCELLFVMPRTKSQIWKTKPMRRLPHAKKPDCDNLCKACLDALSGLLWIDDSQVWDERTTKVIASGDEQPHVLITVTPGRN